MGILSLELNEGCADMRGACSGEFPVPRSVSITTVWRTSYVLRT